MNPLKSAPDVSIFPRPPLWFLVFLGFIFAISFLVLPLCEDCRFRIGDLLKGKPNALGPETTTAPPVAQPSPQPKAVEPPKQGVPKTPIPQEVPPKTAEAPVRPVYKSLPRRGQLGSVQEFAYGVRYHDAHEALKSIRNDGTWVSPWAEDALVRRMGRTIATHANVEAIFVQLRDLGFRENAHLDAIIRRAEARGLARFPIDAVPAVVIDDEEERNLYFATDVMPSDAKWKGVLVYGTVKNLTGLQIIKWDGYWDSPQPFSPSATFVFKQKG